jgi:hypothetical protein
MEQQAAYTAVTRHYDTPRQDVYRAYDERKAEIFRDSETLDEYHARLAELIDELGI